MTENPHRDARIRTGDPRHPKVEQALPASTTSPRDPALAQGSGDAGGVGAGGSGGRSGNDPVDTLVDAWDFSDPPGGWVPPKVVVKKWKRITWSALPQPPTPRESHGTRDRRAEESMRVARRFARS